MSRLVIALPKGRILEEAQQLLTAAGLPLPPDLEQSRRLTVSIPDSAVEIVLAKPMDVPTYVEYGAADIGIVGKDVLLEQHRDVYELMDLRIGACRLSLAGLPEQKGRPLHRVATKYPLIASQYFRSKGRQVEVILLHGSIELAPLTGLAEGIVDIVSTGRTLRENGLVELEEIMPITSRLIANRVSYRLKHRQIEALMANIRQALERGRGDDSGVDVG